MDNRELGVERRGSERLPFCSPDDLEFGRLVRLLPEYRPIEFSMNAIYPHRHHLSAKMRTFIEMLAHHAAQQQKLIDPYS